MLIHLDPQNKAKKLKSKKQKTNDVESPPQFPDVSEGNVAKGKRQICLKYIKQ